LYVPLAHLFAEMELVQKFKEAVATQTVRINKLDIAKKYEVFRAEIVATKCGPSVLLRFKGWPCKVRKAFMPKSFISVFTDEDIDAINTRRVKRHLV
jgi:hypothetical protein